ncbi:MAG: nucleotide sugar dehydrogenase [Flavobacteriales bacterium]|nr:nucleotide sugar dehydrogenase [Flavobacteriales bacterium]
MSTIEYPIQPNVPHKITSQETILERLIKNETTITVVGLGYVGLPLALEFANHFKVIGFDINNGKVQMLRESKDPTGEVLQEEFDNKKIVFSSNPTHLGLSEFIVVAVPTPVNEDKQPDLTPLKSVCRSLGKQLRYGVTIVIESTVYPGCTEDFCIPILEEESGLKLNEDFYVGYSPERINPGDKINTLTTISKVVSGSNEKTKNEVFEVYDYILEAPVHAAPSIKVAEASKIIENTQRDVNIAFMNELSLLFETLEINTQDVLAAASTKWNFMNFYPGLVGGHCIGVDPYYLIHKANNHEMELPLISASRKINDSMPHQIVRTLKDKLAEIGKELSSARVLILGATFKENVSDLRNSKAAELAQLLTQRAHRVDVYDPIADSKEMFDHYELTLEDSIKNRSFDIVIRAVNHDAFHLINWEYIQDIAEQSAIVYDFKHHLGADNKPEGFSYLTL